MQKEKQQLYGSHKDARKQQKKLQIKHGILRELRTAIRYEIYYEVLKKWSTRKNSWNLQSMAKTSIKAMSG